MFRERENRYEKVWRIKICTTGVCWESIAPRNTKNVLFHFKGIPDYYENALLYGNVLLHFPRAKHLLIHFSP